MKQFLKLITFFYMVTLGVSCSVYHQVSDQSDTPECFCSAEDVAKQLHEDCKASVEAIISNKSTVLFVFTYLKT